MITYYAYIRVSTARQGETGVSLSEQRAAIERYAAVHHLSIATWYEERLSAAKAGRPVFSQMLKELKRGRTTGVIIHKIDRGVRNLKDWALLGELIDQGIDVRIANEEIDLQSRGGRLTADIQAVVAADFIRNLREETKKGFYGRIKQGLYPLPAPVGYLNCRRGKVKEINPVNGPLVRLAFYLYGSGEYSLRSQTVEMYRLGLRNQVSEKISMNGLTLIFSNSFYTGIRKIMTNSKYLVAYNHPTNSKSGVKIFFVISSRIQSITL